MRILGVLGDRATPHLSEIVFYVYLLQNKSDGSLYIGLTNDLRKRWMQHNTNRSGYTARKGPWRLAYYEAYTSKSDAIVREKRLKQFKQGYAQLKNRLRGSLKLDL